MNVTRSNVLVGVHVNEVEQNHAEVLLRVDAVSMYRYALVLTGRPDDAQDLVQEATMRFLDAPERLAGARHPSAYARRVIANLYLNGKRREARLRRILPRLAPSLGYQDHAGAHGDREQLQQAIRRLPKRQRVAIVLRYYDDLNFAELAALMECPEATARSLVHRALRSLNVIMTEEESG